MIDDIEAALERSSVRADAKLRLAACLPWLVQAVDNAGAIPPGIVVAAATPRGGICFVADGFPLSTETPAQPAPMVIELHEAIERGATDVVLNRLTRLLGRAGLLAAAVDAETMVSNGSMPVLVLLSEKTGSTVTSIVTVAGMAPRVLH